MTDCPIDILIRGEINVCGFKVNFKKDIPTIISDDFKFHGKFPNEEEQLALINIMEKYRFQNTLKVGQCEKTRIHGFHNLNGVECAVKIARQSRYIYSLCFHTSDAGGFPPDYN